MTRRQLLATAALLPASLRATVFGLPVNTRAKYVFSVGQSLGNGGAGTPALSAHDASTTNRMFSGGLFWDAATAADASFTDHLVDLAEGGTRETHCSGFANQISAWARAAGMGSYHDTVQSSWAVGGRAYGSLKKGTVPYSNAMAAMARIKVLLGDVIVPAILCVHGESDGSCAYAPKVEEWQSDLEADVKAITGQAGTIPMFISQTQAFECASGPFPADPVNGLYDGMLGAHEAWPTKILLCNPKYIFPYQSGGTHLTNAGYRWMGEYYAKAYWKQIVLGQQWSPLRPSSISKSGNVVTIQFTGFVPPLVLDTTTVANPGNYGFEFSGSAGTIQSVALTDPTAGIVQITFDVPPVTGVWGMKYAYTGTPTGPTTGARGCLRDSDPLVSLSGNPLQNWCVHFSKKLTFP